MKLNYMRRGCLTGRLWQLLRITVMTATAVLTEAAGAGDGPTADDGVYEYRISSGDLNSISFPFESISINTASDAEIEVKNGSLYVMPLSDEPITVFVTPAGVSGWNAMLRLIPADIKPRHIRIDPDSVPAAAVSRTAGRTARGVSLEHPSSGKLPRAVNGLGMTSGYGKAFGRNAGENYETALVNGFRTVWEHLRTGSVPDDGKLTAADLSSFGGRIPKFCGLSEEKTVDAFYAGDFLYLVILVNDDSGRDIECGGDLLAYAMLNTMTSFKDTDRILLAALPKDYEGTPKDTGTGR